MHSQAGAWERDILNMHSQAGAWERDKDIEDKDEIYIANLIKLGKNKAKVLKKLREKYDKL